ncbi:molybdenum ABC transporter ATP-binding protein [Chachezhania antarctica]|uniref:molybdenum ABC transporter ATP-binding protein n=1 Tax=Chachezhania antarctica TaxID=2340860 RepID=UPI000EB20CB9|nr:molybdenum ABC transporter ATP-binding protein [Chachezhania antarctica]
MSLSVDIAHRLGSFDLNVAFEAPAGVTALFGRSGSGKTSVVNAVAGLMRPTSGRIALNGDVLFDAKTGPEQPPHRRHLGYVFQEARLFPHLSVRKNLAYGQRFARPGAERPDLKTIADLLDITPLLDRRPGTLSGGERQRVAIGRALLSAPRMLLMDEPLSALDAARKADILPYLEAVRDSAGIPILYVSHNMTEVARLATTVVIMDAGRVVKAGPAEEVLSDLDLVPMLGVRDAGALLQATVLRDHDDGMTELSIAGGTLFLPDMGLGPGSRTRVRIMAHDVILADHRPEGLSALNILHGRVIALRDGRGPGVIVRLDCGGDTLLARITRRSAQALDIAPGREVWAVVKSVSVARTDIGAG